MVGCMDMVLLYCLGYYRKSIRTAPYDSTSVIASLVFQCSDSDVDWLYLTTDDKV